MSKHNVEEAILLGGGSGTRLKPFSLYTSKHLLPIYDVPMIFYPLKNLQLLGIKRVCIIVNERHYDQWEHLVNSYDFAMDISLVIQEKPLGLPDAINRCKDFIINDSFVVALGDNVIVASNFLNTFKEDFDKTDLLQISGFLVSDPTPFGVAKFDEHNNLVKVVEKPKNPPSKFAVVGIYKFPKNVFDIIPSLKLGDRGEYEIVDLINYYIDRGACNITLNNNANDFWLDTGNSDSLLSASNFVRDLRVNKDLKLAQFRQKNK